MPMELPLERTEWDANFVVGVEYLNTRLAKEIEAGRLSLPKLAFSKEGRFGSTSLTAQVSGFELDSDATYEGAKLPAILRLTDIKGADLDGDFKLPELSVSMEFELHQFDQPNKVIIAAVPAKNVKDVRVLTPVEDPGVAALLKSGLQSALEDAFEDFRQEVVALDQSLPVKHVDHWLTPTMTGHAFVPGSASGPACVAVAFMAGEVLPDNPPPPINVTHKMLEGVGKNGAVLKLSTALYTEHLLQPALVQSFFGENSDVAMPEALLNSRCRDSLRRVDDGTSLQLVNGRGPIHLGSQDVDLSPLYALLFTAVVMPIWVLPALAVATGISVIELLQHGKPNLILPMSVQLETFDLTQKGGKITVTTQVKATIMLAGIAIADIKTRVTMTYEPSVGENGVVTIKQVGETTNTTPDLEVPDWLQGSKKVMEVILSVVSAILTIVTEGIAAIVISVVVGAFNLAINTVLPLVLDPIFKDNTMMALPTGVSKFMKGVSAPITVLDTQVFKPKETALTDGLLMGGRLTSDPEAAA